ncbi:MAG: 2OG-Fe(II) oxygenase family protein [Promethearchaeia archaeon]
MGRSREAVGGSTGRSTSPTGASDSRREATLRELHGRLCRSFAHQPHASELAFDELDPSQPGFIIGVNGFLAPHECDEMMRIIDQIGLNPPSAKDLHPRKGEAYLCRESFAFEDASLAAAMFRRMLPFLPADIEGRVPVGLASRLRYYRYLKGHSFGRHVDQSTKAEGGAETEYTALIYLNGQTEEPPLLAGGDTVRSLLAGFI